MDNACKKCGKEKPLRMTDGPCWKCSEILDSLLDHYKKLWLAGEIAVDKEMREKWMDRTSEPF